VQFTLQPSGGMVDAESRAASLADPGFGRVFTDHMISARWSAEAGWHDAQLMPYGPLVLDPASAVLHYSQSVFEGLKAYRQPDGGVARLRVHGTAVPDPRLLDGRLASGQTPVVLNGVTAGCLVLLAVGAAALTLRAPVRPRVGQLAFLLVAGFLLVNKVWSPQYSLWLLPLAVLARPRWRSILLWQATEALLWVPRMLWYLGTANKGVGIDWFFYAVGLRDVAVVGLMALVVRDVLRPDRDVVRTSWPGTDDPAGGVLDRADDVVVLGGVSRPVPA